MLKRCNISWLMGYEKETYMYKLFYYTRKKRFSRMHTKTPKSNVRAPQDVTFWAVGYHPPESQLASFSHTLCKIWEHTYMQRISWDSGGMMFKNIFLIPIFIVQKVTILAPKESRTFMEKGNQMQNPKIETNSELIYEDGIIWSTLISIKIIGSDTLWFPLSPAEVRLDCFSVMIHCNTS